MSLSTQLPVHYPSDTSAYEVLSAQSCSIVMPCGTFHPRLFQSTLITMAYLGVITHVVWLFCNSRQQHCTVISEKKN